MKLEHIGLSVPEPIKMAHWYKTHLNFTIKLENGTDNSGGAFMMDKEENTMLELFSSEGVKPYTPDKKSPLTLHFAFISTQIQEDLETLGKAGAIFIEECSNTMLGDSAFILSDPWGNTIQLVSRAKPIR